MSYDERELYRGKEYWISRAGCARFGIVGMRDLHRWSNGEEFLGNGAIGRSMGTKSRNGDE